MLDDKHLPTHWPSEWIKNGHLNNWRISSHFVGYIIFIQAIVNEYKILVYEDYKSFLNKE